MIVASIIQPHWISYSVTTTKGETLEKHIGLHKSCSSLDDPYCRDFPSQELCQYGERYFCSMWRTVGFMASFGIVLCLATLISFALVMGGGKYRRETGWPFVVVLLTLVSVVEFVVISIVVRIDKGAGCCSFPLCVCFCGAAILTVYRHSCTTMTPSLTFRDGSSMFRGILARLALRCR